MQCCEVHYVLHSIACIIENGGSGLGSNVLVHRSIRLASYLLVYMIPLVLVEARIESSSLITTHSTLISKSFWASHLTPFPSPSHLLLLHFHNTGGVYKPFHYTCVLLLLYTQYVIPWPRSPHCSLYSI